MSTISENENVEIYIKPKKIPKTKRTNTTNVIKNTNTNTKSLCKCCGRTFKRKTNYDTHILICEQLNDNKKMKMMMMDEEGYIPTQTELFYLVRNLVQKCETLETEVSKLRKYVDITKKQINAVDWLNNNITVSQSYDDWVKNITISQEELKNVFKFKYIEGIYQILECRLPVSDTEKHPIKCFNQKNNMFFIYNDNKWSIMTMEIFNDLANTLNARLIRAFYAWKAKHIDEIENDDRMYDKYTENMRIVLGENKTNAQIIQKLKAKLYTYLKCDLKNIVKYEFSF